MKTITYHLYTQFKVELHDLIDRSYELLELINGCVKPKLKEKQENREVYTPVLLINEILDKLDEYYAVLYNKSTFIKRFYMA